MSKNDTPPPGNDDNITPFRPRQQQAETSPASEPAEPAINLPPAVKTLCFLLLAIFLVQEYVLSPETSARIIAEWAFVPARFTGNIALSLADFLTPFTYMFFHGGWMHLLMNVGMLMAFGAGLEKAMGWKKLLIIYFASGIISACVHMLFLMSSDMPLVGASGGISGLFGAIIVMLQIGGSRESKLRALLPFVLIWIVSSAFFGLFGVPGSSANIAWIVHIAGFLSGMAMVIPVARLKIS